ncbi:acyl carrier protein [Campylobacter taeniopygiae]|uniref:acyl carrier protein n=1 Tax=Campylobacter taeniopygiae TaxID=2510188 RepID=UPI003D6C1FBD
MTKENFLIELQDALQTEEVLDEKTKIKDIEEWDSLAILSTIALFDTLFNIKITGDMLRECEYVDDIISLAGDMIEE